MRCSPKLGLFRRTGGQNSRPVPLRLALLILGAAAWAATEGRALAQEVGQEGLQLAAESITEEDVLQHLQVLASVEFEGRDTPSEGLERAALYLEAKLSASGFRGVGEQGSFRVPFSRRMAHPDPAQCSIRWELPNEREDEGQLAVLGRDFVPLPGCTGRAEGLPVYVGFGIDRRGYDDLAKKKLKGKIAVIVEGEPRHPRLFDGPDVLTEAADVYGKLEKLLGEDVAGVLVVRRPPPESTLDAEGKPLAPTPLGYRYTWAQWNPATTDAGPRRKRAFRTPVLEVTASLASELLGEDVLSLAARSDRSGKPSRPSNVSGDSKANRRSVSISSGFDVQRMNIDNVAGILTGSDPVLQDEVIVLGAHYDHLGVDPLGRVALGADDNGSGTAAMLELAQAFALAPPRRSVLIAFFAGEEDGMLGSSSFAREPPVDQKQIVAMFNMDMVGRGDADEVVVLGTRQNPDLKQVLSQAEKIKGSGIKKVVTNRADHLWQRSDHFPFHQAGIPVLFFFEAVSENDNHDYHTFRDTIELLSMQKIVNTARLCLQVAWIVANGDERPGAPRN